MWSSSRWRFHNFPIWDATVYGGTGSAVRIGATIATPGGRRGAESARVGSGGPSHRSARYTAWSRAVTRRRAAATQQMQRVRSTTAGRQPSPHCCRSLRPEIERRCPVWDSRRQMNRAQSPTHTHMPISEPRRRSPGRGEGAAHNELPGGYRRRRRAARRPGHRGDGHPQTAPTRIFAGAVTHLCLLLVGPGTLPVTGNLPGIGCLSRRGRALPRDCSGPGAATEGRILRAGLSPDARLRRDRVRRDGALHQMSTLYLVDTSA